MHRVGAFDGFVSLAEASKFVAVGLFPMVAIAGTDEFWIFSRESGVGVDRFVGAVLGVVRSKEKEPVKGLVINFKDGVGAAVAGVVARAAAE